MMEMHHEMSFPHLKQHAALNISVPIIMHKQGGRDFMTAGATQAISEADWCWGAWPMEIEFIWRRPGFEI